MQIRLLGKPGFTGPDAPQMRGRKSWALLAYLALEDSTPSRNYLADLLFAEADDPIRALRWNLTEIRRALGTDSIGTGDQVNLRIGPGWTVDALEVISAPWWAAEAVETIGRELLEGFGSIGSPGYETWLLSKRRFLQHSAASSLREAALARLGEHQPDKAVASAARLVALDPFDEEGQALLIRCYATAGDGAAAARQLACCTRLLREELGIEPGPAVVEAVHSTATSDFSRPPGRADIEAKLQAGEAAFQAGAFDAGIECLRDAAKGAHALHDAELDLKAWLSLGSALAHAGRSKHLEAAAALHRTIDIATRTGKNEAAGEAAVEMAWIEFMAARYGRARHWIEKALEFGGDDLTIRTRALWIRGKTWMETGHSARSLADLKAADEFSVELGDRARRSFCLASLGRTLLLRGALDEAAEVLERAVGIGEIEGFTWATPLPQAFLGEVKTLWEQFDEAEDVLQRSLASARQLQDSSFETFACRALGVLSVAKHDEESALGWFKQAYVRAISEPDCTWALAYTLDALADHSSRSRMPEADRWIEELEALASSTGMRELLCHCYIYRHRLGDETAAGKARALAEGLDNPDLHRLLDRASIYTGG